MSAPALAGWVAPPSVIDPELDLGDGGQLIGLALLVVGSLQPADFVGRN